MKISRREFLLKSAGTVVVLSAGGLLSTVSESCAGNGPTGPSNVSTLSVIQVTVTGNELSVSIGGSSPVAGLDTRAVAEYNNGSGAVLVEHNSDNTYRALSGICTHQGCIIAGYEGTNKLFVCPCHGSRFDMNGNVAQGPAPRALTQYNTRIENNNLIITL